MFGFAYVRATLAVEIFTAFQAEKQSTSHDRSSERHLVVSLRGYIEVHLFQLNGYFIRDLVPPIQTKTETSIDLLAID